MKLLFTFKHPRSCINILPAVEKLAISGEDVSCFFYNRMASVSSWPSTSPNPAPFLRKRLEQCGARIVGDTNTSGLELVKTFKLVLSSNSFDIAVLDVNKGKMHWGTPLFYRELKRVGTPTIGCQEGSVDDGEAGLKPIAEGLGLNYDYCFCLGDFDRDILLRRNPNLAGRIYTVGLPGNDGLQRYSGQSMMKPEYVMLVPSWTPKAMKTDRFDPMTDNLVESCGIFELAKHFDLPVLIKEKTRPEFAFKHFAKQGVVVTMDETRLDDLIAKSACVVGAPSTLLFKSVQLGIPTAVLGKPLMGQLGVFREFQGLTDSSKKEVTATIFSQKKESKREMKFIERAVCGGSSFDSTDRFIDALYSVLNAPESYCGTRLWSMGLKKGIAQRFPTGYYYVRSFLGRD